MIDWLSPWVPQIELAAVIISLVVISSGALQNVVYLFQLGLAYLALRRRPPVASKSALWRQYGDVTLPISLLAPAYNESATVEENVRSLLALHYPLFEVIIINDGSTDDTLEVLKRAYDLRPVVRSFDLAVPHRPIRGLYGSPRHPRLLVVDKDNGGKADALNAGINVSRSPLFCAVDADSMLESDALLRAVQPFVEEPEQVVAVGGTIRVANGSTVRAGRVVNIALPRSILALLQVIEYLRAFLMARMAWSRINSLTLISGAFGIFRRSVALEVGGYSHGTVGEDMEIIIKIHRRMLERRCPYQIRFIPEPVCWTEVPESLPALGRQRSRWQRGALESFFKHRAMLFNPRYGRVGSLGLGHVLVVDVLGPLFEVLGYFVIPLFWALDLIAWDYMLAFLALTFTFGIFISVGSLILEELELRRFPRPWDLAVLTGLAVLENFGYRQMNNLWRIRGWWQYLRGVRDWGSQVRTGFRKA